MKMTPEQKAFFEYGRARAWLKAHRSRKYFVDVPGMGLYAWHLERDMHGLDALIRDAWKKRAACRAWVPVEERYCSNCRHIEEIADVGTICEKCPHNNGSYYDVNNWEPRKEGE